VCGRQADHDVPAPLSPKGANHHYHKAEDHTPAARTASLCTFPDLFFSIAFIAAVAAQFYFATTYGENSQNTDDAAVNEARKMFTGMVACAAGYAAVTALIYVKIIQHFGGGILKCMVWSCIVLFAGLSGACVAYDQPYFAIPFAVVAVLISLYFCCHGSHIAFAGAVLEISAKVINQNPLTEVIALGMVVLQAGWALTFSVALVGLSNYMEHHGDTYDVYHYFAVWVGIIFVYFWGQQVLRNIVICTTAGATAEWWFNRDGEVRTPTMDAFVRSTTSSLGAIAFGSFFVAIVQTLIYVLQKAKKVSEDLGYKALACVLCIASLILRCIQWCLECFNFYAYVVVGIYGYGFLHAGYHVIEIFMSKGMLLVEEGTLVESVLMLGTAAVALSTGAIGALVVSQHKDAYAAVTGYPVSGAMTICTLVGYGIAHTIFGVVEAANATVFISYVENPHALHRDHPKAYAKLHKAWVDMGREERVHDYANKDLKAEDDEETDLSKPAADGATSPINAAGETSSNIA